MNKIIRWYNQNRKIFWLVILVIIAVIALIQTLNNYYKNDTKDKEGSTNTSATTHNDQNYDIVTHTEINDTTSQNAENIIKNFFDYCNNQNIEEAYNLLSDNCRAEIYPTIHDFTENYYNKIFTENKMYNSTLWISNKNKNTYRIEIMGDILATGQKENMPIEDYYTVIYENGEYKLNISSYIGKEELNVLKTQNDITVTILNKNIYMDYEIYEIKVQNMTQSNVMFNTKESTDSVYLEDENGLKYIAFLNEISEYDLQISRGATKTYNIKFNRSYKPNINIEKVVFDSIKTLQNDEIIKIEVDFE